MQDEQMTRMYEQMGISETVYRFGRQMEEKLAGAGFSKCIAGCLVNLRHVSRMEKDLVWGGNTSLPLSRAQKKQFAKEFVDFLGGGLV